MFPKNNYVDNINIYNNALSTCSILIFYRSLCILHVSVTVYIFITRHALSPIIFCLDYSSPKWNTFPLIKVILFLQLIPEQITIDNSSQVRDLFKSYR